MPAHTLVGCRRSATAATVAAVAAARETGAAVAAKDGKSDFFTRRIESDATANPVAVFEGPARFGPTPDMPHVETMPYFTAPQRGCAPFHRARFLARIRKTQTASTPREMENRFNFISVGAARRSADRHTASSSEPDPVSNEQAAKIKRQPDLISMFRLISVTLACCVNVHPQ